MARTIEKKPIRWRLWLNIALGCVALLVVMYTARQVRRFAVTDPRFTLASPGARLPGLSSDGVVYASVSRVMGTFNGDFGRSVFLMPIAERRRRLLAIDWVEDASIARIWPNRVAVHIKERTPVAFVNLPEPRGTGSRVLLIDGEGVLLEQPAHSHFTFPVLSGVSEEQSEIARRQCVHAMLQLMDDLGGLGKDISEVNAETPDNLIVIMQIEGRALELVMGNRNYFRRLQNFLDHYPEIQRHSGNARAFDLRLDDRVTAGARTR